VLRQEVDEYPRTDRLVALAGVVHEQVGIRQAELGQHDAQAPAVEVSGEVPFRADQDAVAIQRPSQDDVAVIARQHAVHFHDLGMVLVLETPDAVGIVVLAMDDAEMVCNSGNALTPAIMSTKEMGADPTRVAVLMYSAAGICAEQKALDAELRYMRASKANQVTEAQDARVEQKRWAALAAQRQYTGYQMFQKRYEKKYNVALGESCPTLKGDTEQTVYLLGMLSGLQAMTNDINSGGAVQVPKDIAAVV